MKNENQFKNILIVDTKTVPTKVDNQDESQKTEKTLVQINATLVASGKVVSHFSTLVNPEVDVDFSLYEAPKTDDNKNGVEDEKKSKFTVQNYIQLKNDEETIQAVKNAPLYKEAIQLLENWIGVQTRVHGTIGTWASWNEMAQSVLTKMAEKHKKAPSFMKKKHIVIKDFFEDKYVNVKQGKNKKDKLEKFEGKVTLGKVTGFLKLRRNPIMFMPDVVASILLKGRFNLHKTLNKKQPQKR